jgi:hypothetical protein
LVAKKKRLLSQSDWTGISLQTPLTLHYPQPTKRFRESYGSQNLRKGARLNSKKATLDTSSKADDIRVCVGSQQFR